MIFTERRNAAGCWKRRITMGGNLRKCPFCGGKARYVYSMPLNYVECTKCKALGATIVDAYEQRDGKKEAVEAWNHRAG